MSPTFRRAHRRQLTPHNVAELCQINSSNVQPLTVPVMTTTTASLPHHLHEASMSSFKFPRRPVAPAHMVRPRRDSCSEQAAALLRVPVNVANATPARRGSMLVAPCV